MKIFKGTIVIIVLVLIYSFTVPTATQLHKTWKLPAGEQMVFGDSIDFNADGSVSLYYGGNESTGTWVLIDDKIVLTPTGTNVSIDLKNLSIDAGKLNFNVSLGNGDIGVVFE